MINMMKIQKSIFKQSNDRIKRGLNEDIKKIKNEMTLGTGVSNIRNAYLLF